MMKADFILRLVTLIFYICLSFGFSIWLPEHFCELIVDNKDAFSSCKWQVFGFRLVFILLYLPVELVTLAVVYRNATDMIFKIQLRKVTGVSDVELEESKKRSSLAYLMSPDIALNRRQQSYGSYAAAVEDNPAVGRPSSAIDGNQSNRSVNMSERRILDGQQSGLVDDESGTYLP